MPRDPRFAGSNSAEVDGFFQDVKILSKSPIRYKFYITQGDNIIFTYLLTVYVRAEIPQKGTPLVSVQSQLARSKCPDITVFNRWCLFMIYTIESLLKVSFFMHSF